MSTDHHKLILININYYSFILINTHQLSTQLLIKTHEYRSVLVNTNQQRFNDKSLTVS